MIDPGAELDARLATAYGVKLETAAWLPDDDSDPDAVLRAAEAIGRAVGDGRASAVPITERAWILEFASTAAEYLSSPEPARLRAAAADVPPQAVGARYLLRAYLRALADELTA